jgi:hypothetical protein
MADDTLTSRLKNLGQIRLIDLPGAVSPGELALPIEKWDVGFPDQDRSDLSMLKEATQNRLLSESFETSRGLIGSWNLAELMLRAYVEPVKWKGSDQYRSHLGLPILAEHFYSMLGVVQESLFAGYQPFMLDPTSGTDVDTAAAETALVRAQFKKCGTRGCTFKQEMRHVAYDGLLYGTGVAHIGWEQYRQEVKKLRTKTQNTSMAVAGGAITIPQGSEDDVESYVDHIIEFNQAKFEHVPIRRLRVDPSCRRGEIWTAGWAGRLIYLNSYDMDRLRDVDGFKIPTREQLIALTTPMKMDSTSSNVLDTQGANTANPLFQQSVTPQKAYPQDYDYSKADPLGKDWEVFDYWTPYRHVMVLENQHTIYNEPHTENGVPSLSFVFREAPDSFYGYGLGFWLTDYQRIAQGVVNAFFDDVNLNLMGTYTTEAGMNNTAQAQWIFPGKIMKADPGKKIEALTRNSVGMEPLAMIEQIKSWASQISGAGITAQGVNSGKPGDLRNPAAASAIIGGENVKSTDLIDQICDNVFVPFIEYIIEQNHRLKPSQIKQWLSDELSASFKKVDPLSVANGQYKVTVSAASRLRARQQLNSLTGFVQTMIQGPNTVEMLAVQALKLNLGEFYKALIDSTGLPYRENIIQPMTGEDQQRYAASQNQPPPAEKMISLQTESKKEIDNNQAENRLLLKTGEATLKSNAQDQKHQHSVEEDALNRADRSAFQKSDEDFVGGAGQGDV